MQTIQIVMLHEYSIVFSSAGRAKAFKSDLLPMNDEALIRAFCHRHRYSRHAVRAATARAGKMRMALVLGAVVGQFKMPCTSIHKCLVHQPDAQQTFERSIDCDFIESSAA